MNAAHRDPVRRPTMLDVAAEAGVSLKTVSRVVNAEQHVSADVAARVRRAIAELGYRRDRRARDLAAAGTSGRLVGFVQVDTGNPFFAAVYRGLEDATHERDVLLLTGSTDGDPRREQALLETLIEFRVAGVVVAAAAGDDDLLRREVAVGTPVVCVDRMLPDIECDTVVSSNRASTRAAVGRLHQRGHHRVAFLGGDQEVWTARERLAGYRDARRDAGLACDATLEVTDVGDERRAADATRRLLTSPHPPTALFTAQDRITVGAVTSLHDLRRQHEVALIGFDEVPFAEQLVPAIAVVAQDPYLMGRHAGRLLLDRIDGDAPDRGVRVVVDAPLRMRASGSIAPQIGGSGRPR